MPVDRRSDDPSIVSIKDQIENVSKKVDVLGHTVDKKVEHLRIEFKESLEKHESEENERLKYILSIGERNTIVLEKLVENVDMIGHNTQPLVDMNRDLQGTFKILTGLQSFLVSLGKLGIIGGAAIAIGMWIYEHARVLLKL